MTVNFRVDCHTRWGQVLYVVVEGEAHQLKPIGDHQWSCSIDSGANGLTYHYEIREGETVEAEFGTRAIRFNAEDTTIDLVDRWRSPQSLDNVLYTAPFLKSIFARKAEKPIKHSAIHNFQFNLRAVEIPPTYKIGILGNLDELGAWDINRAILLNGSSFPEWSIELCLHNIRSFEYKYVLCDNKGQMLEWEQGENRQFSGKADAGKNIIHDEYARFSSDLWRGAGIALPVFSLRTSGSAGVGEFTDIPAMIDWMADVGFKVFQVLPVNDTVASHTWWDSYPYAAISVDALHPVYANMEAIGPLQDKKRWKTICAEAEQLNSNSVFDYESVMKLKSAFFKLSYDENRDDFLQSKELTRFLANNKSWIYDYAVFSCLRDRFKTADFTQWGQYSSMTDDEVLDFASPRQDHYDDVAVHFYIQYHLDRQLKAASEYGRAKGVVLKGDIPIGIFRHSVDAWRNPHLFHLDQQAGAPPDMFSTTGQNWGFPTYNWTEMEKDGYTWWKQRLQKMSEYFDIIRLDHILGFFRIWQMPADQVQGLLGTFYPSLPMTEDEIKGWGLDLDVERYCDPMIYPGQLESLDHQDFITEHFLEGIENGWKIKEEMRSQHAVTNKLKALEDSGVISSSEFVPIQKEVFRLQSEVLFIRDSQAGYFHPRIDLHNSFGFTQLEEPARHKLRALHDHYYYHRHNDFWRDNAAKKLPVLRDASEMLVCGEDLGMVPDSVAPLMNALQLLQLNVQRFPEYESQFKDLHYLSVKGSGNHDMPTLRQWWQESKEEAERVWRGVLHQSTAMPQTLTPEVATLLMQKQFESSSMWVVIPLQDLTTLDRDVLRPNMDEERINVPENPKNVWQYRFHMNIDELKRAKRFNEKVRKLIEESGRVSR